MMISKKIAACAFLLLGLNTNAFAEPDLDIGVNINPTGKFVEFTVTNYESKAVHCDFIKQRAEYVDTATNKNYGYRVVSVRDITIQPGTTFTNPQGGKEIIDAWEKVNVFAVINELLDNYESKCAIVPDPVVTPPPAPAAPVCRWEVRPKVARNAACGVERTDVIEHVFTPWSLGTSANAKAMCPYQPADISKSHWRVVQNNSRHVTIKCDLYAACAHINNGSDQVKVCE
jgi:hypothetical protein